MNSSQLHLENVVPPEMTQDAGPSEEQRTPSLVSAFQTIRTREDRQTLIMSASRIAGSLVAGQGPTNVPGIVKRSLEIAKGIIAAVDHPTELD